MIGCGKSKNFVFLASQEDGLWVASSLTSRNRHGGDIYLPSHVLESIDCRKISKAQGGSSEVDWQVSMTSQGIVSVEWQLCMLLTMMTVVPACSCCNVCFFYFFLFFQYSF